MIQTQRLNNLKCPKKILRKKLINLRKINFSNQIISFIQFKKNIKKIKYKKKSKYWWLLSNKL